jgi:uncharacterized protein YndB with AHSA1/START domain
MKPVSFTYSGTVASPMDRVFDLLTDPTRMVEWLPGCRNVTPATDRKGKGARHRVEFLRKGQRVNAEIEIIDYNPPTSFGWVEIRGRTGARTFFALQFQGGATMITMKHVWTPKSWRAWLNGQFYRRRHAHATFDGLLQNLRKVLMK